jgi:hypothetical protein
LRIARSLWLTIADLENAEKEVRDFRRENASFVPEADTPNAL